MTYHLWLMRNRRTAALPFIFVTLLIDVIGFGLVIPVLPDLVGKLAGGALDYRAHIYGVLLSVFGLMQFLCAPVLGNLSDRYGRRPVILVSLLCTGLDYVIQALAPTIGWLFLGRVVAGITGASFTAATAYIADVSPPEKRAQNFGLMGAAFGLGFIIGPAMGGLLGQYGTRVPFWAAAIASIVNMLYGYFVLPESLALEDRRPFTRKNLNPFKSLGILGREKWVLMLSGAAFLLWLAQQVPPSSWVLYTEYRFGWDKRANGLSLGLLGLASMFVQVWLIRVLSKKYGDKGLLAIGLAFNFVGFIFLGSSSTGAMMLASMVLWTVCFVGGPAIQSLVSQQFDETEQGAAQGALTAIYSLTSVVGPPIFTFVFGYFTIRSSVKVPGSPFFLGAVFTMLAALLARLALGHGKGSTAIEAPS